MLRLFFGLSLLMSLSPAFGQQHSIGIGVYSGFTIPFTLDKGMDQDPRYSTHYGLKGVPIGFAFMKDLDKFGFVISPGIFTTGQNYNIVNTEGGHDGTRKLNMKHFMLPFAFKLHIIDLEFFRISALASITGSFLYKAEDIVEHSATKLYFPTETHPYLPESYTPQYDGVLTPTVSDLSVSTKSDYQAFQLFGGLGLRSDWDVSNHWRVSIDLRVNIGLNEPRNSDYLSRINTYQSIYDFPGDRREMFTSMTFGIARFLDFDVNDKKREKSVKGTRKVYVPQKAPQHKYKRKK